MVRRATAQEPFHPINVHIGWRIRARRTALGMNQSDLAQRLGMSFQQVQKYEKGRNALSADRLIDMAQALEVHLTYFFDGYDRAAAVLEPSDARQDRLQLHLMRLFEQVPSHQRIAIVQLLAAMAKCSEDAPELQTLVSDASSEEAGARVSKRPRRQRAA